MCGSPAGSVRAKHTTERRIMSNAGIILVLVLLIVEVKR
jgi:hypothetical protein